MLIVSFKIFMFASSVFWDFCVALGWVDHGLMDGRGWEGFDSRKTKASEVSIHYRVLAHLAPRSAFLWKAGLSVC